MTAKKDKNFSTRPIKSEIGIASLEDTITVGETGVKRTNKPLMEKRRRARINQSLQILKAMIVEANTKNVSKAGDGQQKHNKLEKADILEITVRHFQRHRNLDNPEVNKYRAGYADCAREVSRYLATPEPPPFPSIPSLADPGAKSRLLKHLEACVGEIDVEITSKPERMHPVETNPLDFSKSSPHLADLTRTQKQDPNNNSDKVDPPKRSSKRSSRGQSPGNTGNSNKRVRNSKQEEVIIVKEEIVDKPDMSNDEKVLLLSKHYVQLASALGLNPQAMLETSPTTTDFESLIELSKHQPHMLQQQHLLDPPQPIDTMDSNYWDMYKKNLGINDSKSCPSTSPTSFKDLKIPSPVSSSQLPLQDKVGNLSNKIPDDIQSLKSTAGTVACPSTKYVNKKKDMIRMHDEIELKTMQAKSVVCSEASDGASAASISSDVSEKHFSGQSSENSCENLENQQQNYVGDDEDVWRPW